MEIIVFERDAYYRMMFEVMSMVKQVVKEAQNDTSKQKEIDWIEVDEAKKLLGLKSKTVMQRLRSNGDIVFTKYGKKIKYSRKSIMEYLNNNKISFR